MAKLLKHVMAPVLLLVAITVAVTQYYRMELREWQEIQKHKIEQLKMNLSKCDSIKLDHQSFQPEVTPADSEFKPIIQGLSALLNREPVRNGQVVDLPDYRLELFSKDGQFLAQVYVSRRVRINTLWFDISEKELHDLDSNWNSAYQRIMRNIYFYPTGEKKASGHWREGKKDGEWLYFEKDGSLTRKEMYRQGELLELRDLKINSKDH